MSLKDAIDAYFRDVDDEQFLKDVRAAGFKPIPRRSWADRLAFALMGLAALIDRKVWQKMQTETRTIVGEWTAGWWNLRKGDFDYETERYTWRGPRHDGWRPGRYV